MWRTLFPYLVSGWETRIRTWVDGVRVDFIVICSNAGEAFINRVFPVFSLDYDNFSTFNFVSFYWPFLERRSDTMVTADLKQELA